MDIIPCGNVSVPGYYIRDTPTGVSLVTSRVQDEAYLIQFLRTDSRARSGAARATPGSRRPRCHRRVESLNTEESAVTADLLRAIYLTDEAGE